MTFWLWTARMMVITPLAVLRVDADVIRVTTDFIHRCEFRVAALQEVATIRATERMDFSEVDSFGCIFGSNRSRGAFGGFTGAV
jgi:hypothetical protein